MHHYPVRVHLYRIGSLLGATILTIGMLEGLLRIFAFDGYYVWYPNLRHMFHPMPELLPGVSGASRFHINAYGIRGEAFSQRQDYRILAVGGSTTECLFLDEEEAWPGVLQEILNGQLERRRAWVGNVGRSGHNTRHHLLQVEKLLPQYPRLDAILLLTGLNDLSHRLAADTAYVPYDRLSPEEQDEVLDRAFVEVPRRSRLQRRPYYKNTELWYTLRRAKWVRTHRSNYVQDEQGAMYERLRRRRQAATAIRDYVPDLATALDEYRSNIHAILDRAGQHRVRVILMTQPVLWRPDLPPELDELLWFGGVGGVDDRAGEYYSVAALSEAMARYNRTLLEVCADRMVECLDLASSLPRNLSVFYDDAHFNVAGAKKVADTVAAYLLAHPPFAQWRVGAASTAGDRFAPEGVAARPADLLLALARMRRGHLPGPV